MARAELARLVGSPGSGPSYFFGYSEFLRLRRDVEQALGAQFDQRAYHDFVLAQGNSRCRPFAKPSCRGSCEVRLSQSGGDLHDLKGDPSDR